MSPNTSYMPRYHDVQQYVSLPLERCLPDQCQSYDEREYQGYDDFHEESQDPFDAAIDNVLGFTDQPPSMKSNNRCNLYSNSRGGDFEPLDAFSNTQCLEVLRQPSFQMLERASPIHVYSSSISHERVAPEPYKMYSVGGHLDRNVVEQNHVAHVEQKTLEVPLKELKKPKRCLSAYNLFFQEERLKLLSSLPERGQGTSKSSKKSHGKIGFADMAKTIAKRWKQIDPDQKLRYEFKAAIDSQRYEREMVVWKKYQTQKEMDEWRQSQHERQMKEQHQKELLTGKISPSSFH